MDQFEPSPSSGRAMAGPLPTKRDYSAARDPYKLSASRHAGPGELSGTQA